MAFSSAAPQDYISLSADLTFGPSSSRVCVDFNATEDNIIEGLENLTVSLTSSGEVILQPDEAEIIISEDEGS